MRMDPTPPHSAEAEESVLGGLLLDNAAYDRIAGQLRPEHFYHPERRAVYQTITRLIGANLPADVVTVYEAGDHDLRELNAFAESVPSAANIRRYAEIIRSRWSARQLMRIAGTAVCHAADTQRDPLMVALETQEALAQIGEGLDDRMKPVLIGRSLDAHLELLTARAEGRDTVYPTGLHDFDRMLVGGLRPGRLYVLGGRPGMGKTTTALNILRHVAQFCGVHVLLLSQELPAQTVHDALIAAAGNVDLARLLQPAEATDEDWHRIVDGAEALRSLPLTIDEQPALQLADVRAKAQEAKRQGAGKLGLIVVDYLQLMQGDGESRSVQIGAIANGLKTLAKRLDCAVLALSACNREADKKPDGADSMSDLHESGGIEAAADCIALVHRDFVLTNDKELEFYGQLRVVKNRVGSTGRVHLRFDGAKQRVGSWSGAPPTPRAVRGRRRSADGYD